MEFVISFDMRSPTFGAPTQDLYDAALQICEWGDRLGFNCVGLGEHHGSEDGYLPSPIPFAGAIAGCTRRITIRPNVLIAPLYDPVKLAEDLSVLQWLSNGRLQVVIGAGYRPFEFQMFGTRREARKQGYLDAFDVLRRAWSGETFEYRGRTVTVRPRPPQPPPLLLGGSHPAVARRAARIADGYYPPGGENWQAYRDERLALGKSDPGPRFHTLGPIFTYITSEVDEAWERLVPHIQHCVESYAEWTIEAYGSAAGPFAAGVDMAALRDSGAYQVLTPEQAVAQIKRMDECSTFILTPLLGGLDPAFAWESLRLFESQVWPEVKHLASPLPIPGRA